MKEQITSIEYDVTKKRSKQEKGGTIYTFLLYFIVKKVKLVIRPL